MLVAVMHFLCLHPDVTRQYNVPLSTADYSDLSVCESTEALTEGLLVVESERAGEAAEVT